MSLPLPIGIYGTGPRAEACARAVALSAQFASVARVETSSADGLSLARGRAPGAAWAVALGPRESARALAELAATDGAAVILGPARGAPWSAENMLAAPRPGLRIAHGWVTQRGPLALAGHRQIEGELIVRGLSDGHPADRFDLVAEALAVALRLTPRARVTEVSGRGSRFELRGDRGRLRVTACEGAPRLTASLEVDGQRIEWHATESEETFDGRRYVTRPFVERALAQLLSPPGTPTAGDGIRELLEVQALAAQILDAAPAVATPGLGALASPPAAPGPLGAIGLTSPDSAPSGRSPDEPAPPATEAFELVAFRAGIKPVVFMTVKPDEEAAVREALGGGVHIERHLRRVARDARDRWVDDRQSGEAAVELFASRDAGRAKRAADLQLTDPTRNAGELGELLGYPSCCVEAFAAQTSRADNSYDRLQIAARTERRDHWPWELNDLALKVVPFYPCRYDCPEALTLARRALAALPANQRAEVERFLARPVLYFHDGEQLWMEGEADRRRARFGSPEALEARGAGARRLGAILMGAGATGLRLAELSLSGIADGQDVVRLGRTEPGLGFLAPFG